MYLSASLENVDRMPQQTFDQIVEEYVELNIAHPFREMAEAWGLAGPPAGWAGASRGLVSSGQGRLPLAMERSLFET